LLAVDIRITSVTGENPINPNITQRLFNVAKENEDVPRITEGFRTIDVGITGNIPDDSRKQPDSLDFLV